MDRQETQINKNEEMCDQLLLCSSAAKVFSLCLSASVVRFAIAYFES
jgi:hypothetical protein